MKLVYPYFQTRINNQLRSIKMNTKINIKRKDIVIFELVWALIFFIIGIYPFFNNYEPRIWAFIIAGLFLIISIIAPYSLKLFYINWIKFGNFIGKIISTIVLSIVFFLLVTPIGFLLKIFGKDLLQTKYLKSSQTYWLDRAKQPTSMKNQF